MLANPKLFSDSPLYNKIKHCILLANRKQVTRVGNNSGSGDQGLMTLACKSIGILNTSIPVSLQVILNGQSAFPLSQYLK